MSRRKQLVSILMLFILAFSVVLPAAQPEQADAADISIYVNGKYLATDQPPVIQDGRTMVPLRPIFEALGATVEWFGDTQTISAYDPKTNRIMSLVVNQRTMFRLHLVPSVRSQSNLASCHRICPFPYQGNRCATYDY